MSINLSTEQIAATQKVAIDNLLSLAQSSLNTFEKFNTLSLSTTRSLFAGQLEGFASLLSAKNPQDILSVQKSLAESQIKEVAAYAHQFHDIANTSHKEFADLLETQHAELNNKVASFLDGYANSSDNSGTAVAAVKSAISAANSAFANANKAARQVVDITNAGVNATVQAIGAASQHQSTSRKKAA